MEEETREDESERDALPDYPVTVAEITMWPLVDTFITASESVQGSDKTSPAAYAANDAMFKAVTSLEHLKAMHDRLSTSGRFYGQAQVFNRLVCSAGNKGCAFPTVEKDGKITTQKWSGIRDSKRKIATAWGIFGTLFGAGSDDVKRLAVFEGALIDEPKAKKGKQDVIPFTYVVTYNFFNFAFDPPPPPSNPALSIGGWRCIGIWLWWKLISRRKPRRGSGVALSVARIHARFETRASRR